MAARYRPCDPRLLPSRNHRPPNLVCLSGVLLMGFESGGPSLPLLYRARLDHTHGFDSARVDWTIGITPDSSGPWRKCQGHLADVSASYRFAGNRKAFQATLAPDCLGACAGFP